MFMKQGGGSVVVESVIWSIMPEKCLKRKERTYQSLSSWRFSADKAGSVSKLLQDKNSLHATNKANKVCLKLCRRLEEY